VWWSFVPLAIIFYCPLTPTPKFPNRMIQMDSGSSPSNAKRPPSTDASVQNQANLSGAGNAPTPKDPLKAVSTVMQQQWPGFFGQALKKGFAPKSIQDVMKSSNFGKDCEAGFEKFDISFRITEMRNYTEHFKNPTHFSGRSPMAYLDNSMENGCQSKTDPHSSSSIHNKLSSEF
jgi:hypothetical protein